MHRQFCSGFGISAYYPHIFLLYNMLILSNHYMYIFFFDINLYSVYHYCNIYWWIQYKSVLKILIIVKRNHTKFSEFQITGISVFRNSEIMVLRIHYMRSTFSYFCLYKKKHVCNCPIAVVSKWYTGMSRQAFNWMFITFLT